MNPSPLPHSRTLLTSLINQLSFVQPQPPQEGPYSQPQRPYHELDLPPPATNNPLQHASQEVKNLFLTLHVLFPHEVLPALDLLDRKLITRFVVGSIPLRPPSQTPLPVSITTRNEEVTSAASREEESAEQGQAVNATQAQPGSEQETGLRTDPEATTGVSCEEKKNVVYYVRSSTSTHSGPGRPRQYTAHTEVINYEVRLIAWNCSCPAFTFGALAALEFPAEERNQGARGARLGGGILAGEGGWRFGGLGLGENGNVPVCKHLLACLLGEKIGMLRGYVKESIIGREEAAGWGAGWGG